jgi:hypothetical protein
MTMLTATAARFRRMTAQAPARRGREPGRAPTSPTTAGGGQAVGAIAGRREGGQPGDGAGRSPSATPAIPGDCVSEWDPRLG